MQQRGMKWLLALLMVTVVSVPVGAVELKLSGSYEMQGRYYNQGDIVHARWSGGNAAIGSQEIARMAASYTATRAALQQTPSAPGSLVSLWDVTPVATRAAIEAAMALEDPFVPDAAVRDTVDNDKYLKHYFYLDPTLVVSDRVAVHSNLVVYENKLSSDEYPEAAGDEYDAHNIFRVDNLWAEVLTDYGFFMLGKTPDFLGIGYMIKLPGLENFTFGLVWDKGDEDGADAANDLVSYASLLAGNPAGLDSDNGDEDAVMLVVNYATERLELDTGLSYGWNGSDNSEASVWAPMLKMSYAGGPWTIDAHGIYVNGIFAARDSNAMKTTAYQFNSLLGGYDPALAQNLFHGASQPRLADDWEFNGSWAAFVDVSYDMGAVSPRLAVAYASGAEKPNEISGCFSDDQTFGSWLMNDVSDRYAGYFETPVSNSADALGDPNDDDYSFSNILLVRLGADAQLSEKLAIAANLLWARRASTDYLENWNPEMGVLNAFNPSATRIAAMGQYGNPADRMTNEVDEGLGWELNAKCTYRVQDNLTCALQASYYQPGDFYESAFEQAFATATERAANPFGTGLEVEPEYAARWIATIDF